MFSVILFVSYAFAMSQAGANLPGVKASVVVYSGPLIFSLMNIDGREINQVHAISSLQCQRCRAAFN